MAFLSGIISAPFFFSGEEKNFSHASADMTPAVAVVSIPALTVEEAIAILESAPEKPETKSSELCGKDDLFSAFSAEEKSVVASAWKDIPCDLLQNLKKVVIFDDINKPRALAGASSLHLRSDIFSLPEAEKVIIHETGHLVDLGGLISQDFSEKSGFVDGSLPVFADDVSADYYALSWNDTDSWNVDTTIQDFVSRYGATDPFEDFAESFLFYVAHGASFRELAAENAELAKKYDFFKNEVFAGEEFDGELIVVTAERPWDATRI